MDWRYQHEKDHDGFDQASNKKVKEFLRKPENALQVVVKAEQVDNELKLLSIENREWFFRTWPGSLGPSF